ncbi:MAG: ABC transporter ATP-binding protein [Acidimicrobiales bacterium]
MGDGVPTRPLLDVSGVSVRFGGVQALLDVALAVGEGESVALVGPNGAGKTTLFDCISGQRRADGGTVDFAGRRIDGLAAHRRARLGIARTFQRLEVFPELTVREHLLLAARARRGDAVLWKDLLHLTPVRADERAESDQLIEMLGLAPLADVPVASLGLGRCRLVEIARALATGPRLLLADEPSSGLDPHEADELASVLKQVTEEHGVALLLVEHDLRVVAACASRVIVLDTGQVIAEGGFDDVIALDAVRKAYLGAAP